MRIESVACRLVMPVALFLTVACDRTPVSPTRPSTRTPPATRLEIQGPRDVPPGASVQFKAVVGLSDGSTHDVTAEASWASLSPAILSISSMGIATAHREGEAHITATVTNASNAHEVVVIPAGTFRLTGVITEDSGAVRVGGARVEVTRASGESISTSTEADGRYRLYGVASGARLRVTKEEYEPYVHTLSIDDHASLDVGLRLMRPRPDLSGTYTLIITASGTCSAELPEEARRRTYTAVARQYGALVNISLENASFFESPVPDEGRKRYFSGVIAGDRVTFTLHPFGEDYADVIEEFAPARFFVPAGTITAPASSAAISATMNGDIGVWQPTAVSAFGRIALCRAEDHHFLLTR